MKKLCLVLVLALLLPLMAVPAAQAEDVVTIEYWQYYFESKVALIDELIAQFDTNLRQSNRHKERNIVE